MRRGGVWQGIRDWFRPVDRAPQSTTRRPAAVSARSDGADADRPADSSVIHSRAWTRAMLDGDADASNVIPFPGGSHTGEAVLDDVTDAQELLDFMAADLDPVPADPDFRERLREELWERILAEGVGRRDERKDR